MCVCACVCVCVCVCVYVRARMCKLHLDLLLCSTYIHSQTLDKQAFVNEHVYVFCCVFSMCF